MRISWTKGTTASFGWRIDEFDTLADGCTNNGGMDVEAGRPPVDRPSRTRAALVAALLKGYCHAPPDVAHALLEGFETAFSVLVERHAIRITELEEKAMRRRR